MRDLAQWRVPGATGGLLEGSGVQTLWFFLQFYLVNMCLPRAGRILLHDHQNIGISHISSSGGLSNVCEEAAIVLLPHLEREKRTSVRKDSGKYSRKWHERRVESVARFPFTF